MSRERWLRILSAVATSCSGQPTPTELCAACVDILAVNGAGIMVMGTDLNQGPLGESDARTATLEELQFTVGQGPAAEAYANGATVIETDLVARPPPRWMAFTGPATDAGVRAVFSFPLRVGVARLGALTLYCDRPGPLTGEEHADAVVLADVVTYAILTMQANVPPGMLLTELADQGGYFAEVHQASGMISVHLGVTVGVALVRLRAHAFATGRSVSAVAADVVGCRLRLEA